MRPMEAKKEMEGSLYVCHARLWDVSGDELLICASNFISLLASLGLLQAHDVVDLTEVFGKKFQHQ